MTILTILCFWNILTSILRTVGTVISVIVSTKIVWQSSKLSFEKTFDKHVLCFQIDLRLRTLDNDQYGINVRLAGLYIAMVRQIILHNLFVIAKGIFIFRVLNVYRNNLLMYKK